MLSFVQSLQSQVGAETLVLYTSKGHSATNCYQSDQNTKEHQYTQEHERERQTGKHALDNAC